MAVNHFIQSLPKLLEFQKERKKKKIQCLQEKNFLQILMKSDFWNSQFCLIQPLRGII